MTSTNNIYGAARWRVAIMGTILQVCLGTIYAWSYLQKPLMEYAQWNNRQVAWVLSLAICCLGLAAAVGGMLLPRIGPLRLAVTGILLYACGWVVGGFALANQSLTLLYVGLGVIGGAGLGLGYVTPVATAAKWFPDKKGLVTGMVVMGFGFGALLMSKVIAPLLVDLFTKNGVTNWPYVFYAIAVALGIPGVIAAVSLRNPPAEVISSGSMPASVEGFSCVCSRRFTLMWLVFFCNITAGIMFIGFQSPLLQDLLKARDGSLDAKALAVAGATLIAVSSLFNGVGRFAWGTVSDRIGRMLTFRLILGTQVIAFVALFWVKAPLIFGSLVCYVLLCYGGGFGTAPSLVSTVFGSQSMSIVYGCLLTAWSAGGLIGPQVVAFYKDAYPAQSAQYSFATGAAVLAAGFLVACLSNDLPHRHNTRET